VSGQKRKAKGANQTAMAILGGGLAVVLVLGGYAMFRGPGASLPADQPMDKEEKAACTHSPVRASMEGLERVPCTTANHVPEGQTVTYSSDPPLSGEHYPTWINPGFYTQLPPKEKLVHSLEHGHVVIYYDQARLSASEMAALEKLARRYKGMWDGVSAVPKAGEHAIILTAWEHMLRLERYDQSRIDAFVDAFRGRGPENPVRP